VVLDMGVAGRLLYSEGQGMMAAEAILRAVDVEDAGNPGTRRDPVVVGQEDATVAGVAVSFLDQSGCLAGSGIALLGVAVDLHLVPEPVVPVRVFYRKESLRAHG
jgi:hypothetical protein